MNPNHELVTEGIHIVDDIAPADSFAGRIHVDAKRSPLLRRRGWLVRRVLLVADIVGLSTAVAIVGLTFGFNVQGAEIVPLIIVFLGCWIVLAKLYGLYDRDEERTGHATLDDVPGIFNLLTVVTWIVTLSFLVFEDSTPSLKALAWFWVLAFVMVIFSRTIGRFLARRNAAYKQNTLIVGAGEVGQLIAHKLLLHPEYGINLIGFVDADPPESRRSSVSQVSIIGPPSRLIHYVNKFDIERVIVAFSKDTHEETLDQIRSLPDHDVQVDIVPRLFEALGSNVGINSVEGVPLLGLPTTRLSRSSLLLKRTIDIVGALVGLTLLAPFFAFAAARIKLGSAGPVFFRQVRMGSDEKTFRIFKFRTMQADADTRKHEIAHLNVYHEGGDTRMFKVANDPRVTGFGATLRRYSLDELPQLINVFLGDMSLVGPRPLILEEDQHVSQWGRRRLKLKPGLTGPWQVLGRNDIPFDEMVKLDYLYVNGWTLWGDIRLIFQTIPAIIRPRNAY